MKHFCEYYIPNNSDYFRLAGCIKTGKLCPYAGDYPEYSTGAAADNQKQCQDYQEWQDPIKLSKTK